LFDWRAFAIGLAIVAGLAFAASMTFGLGFLPTFALALAGLLVNGFIATAEDDLPGGFNNPDGTHTPRYARRLMTVGRWGIGLLIWGFGTTVLVLGIVSEQRGATILGASIFLACALFSVAVLKRRRWALWSAILCAVAGIGASTIVR
jgi:hypothetical protein